MAITGLNIGVDYRGAVQAVPAQTAAAQYLRDNAEPNLFKNYELVRWGVDAVQPAGMGVQVYAPTFDDILKNSHSKACS